MRCQDLVRLSWIMFLAASPAVAAVPSYRVEYLGAGWTGTGMNEHGVVCGNVSPDGTALIAGVSHDGQPFEPLPLPPGMQSSRAHDINDAGVIVGAVCPNVYVITQPTAAVWRPTADGYEVEVLGALPGDPYSQWVRDPVACCPPGGEPLPDVQARVLRAIGDIAAAHPDGDDVLVVAHGGVISAYLAHYLGLPLSSIWRLTLSNGSLSRVAPPRVLSVNDTAHLDGLDGAGGSPGLSP